MTLAALTAAGNDVKAGLWKDSDAAFLEDCATRLAQLQFNADATNDADRRDQYREAAQLQVKRLEAVMFERANATGNEVLEDVCTKALQIGLKARFGLLLP